MQSEEMSTKVSIVIPVYGVEDYIGRCLRSVMAQTYRHVEVILVDDCSPDNSMEVARGIIEAEGISDMTFVCLRHQHNRGLSAARNTGIGAATGDYVYFLDSDDAITADCIERLAAPLAAEHYDFVVGDFVVEGAGNHLRQLTLSGPSSEALKAYLDRKWYQMAWNKLVCLQFLKEQGLYFEEGLIHEDELWSFQLACAARRMYGVIAPTYRYIIRDNSIMTSERIEQRIRTYLHIAGLMWRYIDSHGRAEDDVANHVIEAFTQSAHRIYVVTPRMEGYGYYRIIRRKNRRDRRIYWHMSRRSVTGFVKYSHYLLPVPLGFALKVLLRLPVLLRECSRSAP